MQETSEVAVIASEPDTTSDDTEPPVETETAEEPPSIETLEVAVIASEPDTTSDDTEPPVETETAEEPPSIVAGDPQSVQAEVFD